MKLIVFIATTLFLTTTTVRGQESIKNRLIKLRLNHGRSLAGWTGLKIGSPLYQINTNKTGFNKTKSEFNFGAKLRTTTAGATLDEKDTAAAESPTTPFPAFLQRTPGQMNSKFKKMRKIILKKERLTTTTTMEPLDSSSLQLSSEEVEVKIPAETARGASGIDPHHPAIQQAIASHNNHQPTPHAHKPVKKLRRHQDTSTSLLELDKTLVYVGMIFSWIFWIVVFTTYYTWGQKHGHPVPGKPGFYKNRPVVLNLGGHTGPHFVQTRSVSPEGWLSIINKVTAAQDLYDKFDLRSLECQKKALCELAASNTSTFQSSIFKLLEAIETMLPAPAVTYFKEYRTAVEKSTEDCQFSCEFSLAEFFNLFGTNSGESDNNI